MADNRRLSALPATDTKDARACALKTVMGMAVNVGMRTGKTVEARTCGTVSLKVEQELKKKLTLITSFNAWRAVPEPFPGWRSASSKVGMV